MSNLLSKLNNTSRNKPIEPRKIFMSLPTKDKRYEYPRDVQSEVWEKWFEQRNNKNTIIKMNTGSGKTVVGLTILQSCLNEGKGPAIYVVPDNYLVEQVCKEAEKLGIRATKDKDDYYYTEGKAILVTSIYTLVNGKSVFGMRASNNYPLESILIDDVHACLDTITTQFSLRIPAKHDLYNKVIGLFADDWKSYHRDSYIELVEIKESQKNMLLPFWIWQEKQEEVYRLLKQYDNAEEKNKFIYFNLPLIANCLQTCNCMITANFIEITPKGIPISKITSFEKASRRIFMSATLSDDSVFVSALGLNHKDIKGIISPNKASDIGDRLILFPKHLNSKITDDEVKEKINLLSKEYNVVVIVPSEKRGEYWDPAGDRTVTKENINEAVEKLKNQNHGLFIFVNRYDGIDLPDDACRLLVIDGLPPFRCEYEKYVQSINPNSSMLLKEQVQRIEQGMGRGVRSNSDTCCIVLMGDALADFLLRNKGVTFFSNATKEQYNLSKELWELLKEDIPNPSIDDIFGLAEFSLKRNVEWITKSKECISEVSYDTKMNINETIVSQRKAFENAYNEEWKKAADLINDAVNKENDEKMKGYLLQIKAEYVNIFDKSTAQQILKAARKYNAGTLLPISGIHYDKLVNNIMQPKGIMKYFNSLNGNSNEHIIHMHAVMADLNFEADADDFEKALQELGKMLGFESSRPDKETCGKGPDNLWAVGNNTYFVIECKNEAVVEAISKDYCNQLGGSLRWFEEAYGKDYHGNPIMVYKSNHIDKMATPVPNMRIITEEALTKLKKQVSAFVVALMENGNLEDETKINSLLKVYKLQSKDFLQEYTMMYKSNN